MVSALPASRENRELIAPPTMIGLRSRRLFVRGFACLLLGVLLSIATVAAAHSGCNIKSLHPLPPYLRSTSTPP